MDFLLKYPSISYAQLFSFYDTFHLNKGENKYVRENYQKIKFKNTELHGNVQVEGHSSSSSPVTLDSVSLQEKKKLFEVTVDDYFKCFP